MEFAGFAEDGKIVVKGTFSFYETHGLPVDMLAQLAYERGWLIDWVDFLTEAMRAGMKLKTAELKMLQAIEFVHGTFAAKEAEARYEEFRNSLPC